MTDDARERAAVVRSVAEELNALPEIGDRTLGPGIVFAVYHLAPELSPFAERPVGRVVCGLGTCGRPAVVRAQMTYLRRLAPEGVTSKEQVLCGPCLVDKTAEFKEIGGEVRPVEWIGQPPAE